MSDDDVLAYSAVFWDIGGVIVELRSVRAGYAAFIEELAGEYDLDPEAALDQWKAALGEHFKSRDGTEYRLAREGYRRATESLFDDPPPEAEWRALFERCTTETLRPEAGAPETIRSLDDAGVYLGIISDIDTPEAHTMLEAFGIDDCFDDVTTSEEVGRTKPDPAMFEAALTKADATADVDPERGLMVGDRYAHDIEGAARAGLATVAYGEDARGPQADHVVEDIGEVLDIVGVGRRESSDR